MQEIPDAPWIREAERYGVPDRDPVHCPICNAECDWIFLQQGDPVGCENCITQREADEWYDEKGDI